MKFGVFIPQGWRLDLPKNIDSYSQWKIIKEVALKAEELGYNYILVYDHFHTVPKPIPGRSVFEAWTLMASLASITKKIRLGQLVTCVLYRSPAYLAKVSSVVDVISNGRVELGLGACWYLDEFNGYGYSFPRARDRIFMLDEAIQVIKLMWTRPKAYFDGKYFKLNGALNDPKPIQKPHPPILIGGGGEKYTLKVAAKHANKWHVGGPYEIYLRKMDILRKHCENVGRDFNEIVLTYGGTVIIDREEKNVRKKFEEYEPNRIRGTRYEEMRERTFLGTPEEIAEKIEKFKKIGVKEIYLFFPYAYRLTELELFRDDVMREFK